MAGCAPRAWESARRRVWTVKRDQQSLLLDAYGDSGQREESIEAGAANASLVALRRAVDVEDALPKLFVASCDAQGSFQLFCEHGRSLKHLGVLLRDPLSVTIVHGPHLVVAAGHGFSLGGLFTAWPSNAQGHLLSVHSRVGLSGLVVVHILANVERNADGAASFVLYEGRVSSTNGEVTCCEVPPSSMLPFLDYIPPQDISRLKSLLLSDSGTASGLVCVAASTDSSVAVVRNNIARWTDVPGCPHELVLLPDGSIAAHLSEGWWMVGERAHCFADADCGVLLVDWLNADMGPSVVRVDSEDGLLHRTALSRASLPSGDGQPTRKLPRVPAAIAAALESPVLQHAGHVRALAEQVAKEERINLYFKQQLDRSAGVLPRQSESTPIAGMSAGPVARVRWSEPRPLQDSALGAALHISAHSALRFQQWVWVALWCLDSTAVGRYVLQAAAANPSDSVAVSSTYVEGAVYARCSIPRHGGKLRVRVVHTHGAEARQSAWLDLDLSALPVSSRPDLAFAASATHVLSAPSKSDQGRMSTWAALGLRSAGSGLQATDGTMLMEVDARGNISVIDAAHSDDVSAAVDRLQHAGISVKRTVTAQERQAIERAERALREEMSEQGTSGIQLELATDAMMIQVAASFQL